MIPSNYSKFIKEIIQKTEEGIAKWEKGFEGSLLLKSKNSTIEIGKYTIDDEELHYYYFKFINIENKNQSMFRISNDQSDYKVMENLYIVASASANNIEEELDNFLDSL
ncbi:hypothetical protein [Flavobacterium suncheonense]|uniref:Uncharacterized protein n=1 Tax=Flavobacterium suncheonense GH29-5 = DSM 17707 TaxID=1121899 RepID=A0A0A2LYZ5_9FLAO|nr:hypothetical protein [Flavobacterium suncheonense]KGO85209.1 hypothetical protein Q764_14205 [Flavobacterium suncheonense GH29-5 = DSM 17707]